MPPTRVYFLGLLVWSRVYFWQFLSRQGYAGVRFFEARAIMVKEKSNCGNSCIKTYNFGNFGPEKAKIWQFLLENASSSHFDVEFSLGKGIIFTKMGVAKGTILKLWAVHPKLKFIRDTTCLQPANQLAFGPLLASKDSLYPKPWLSILCTLTCSRI